MEILLENDDYKWSKDDGIVVFEYLAEHVTLEIAQNVIKDKAALYGSETHPSIIDASGVKNFDSDARKLMGSEEGNKGISKCAFITSSKVQNVMFNFFLAINKPKVPMRMFDNYEKAKSWLNTFI